MKLKLPITDQFLWDLYNFIQELDRTFDLFAPRTMKEAVFPELLRLKREHERKKAKRQFSQLIYYLKKKGYIRIKNLEQKQGVILTKKGKEKVLKVKFKIKEKKRRKDGKFEMIIFDIPEKKRHLRNLLREALHLLGYQMLQQSVWVCPYEVLEETEEIVRKYSLDPYVRIFLIEEIEI